VIHYQQHNLQQLVQLYTITYPYNKHHLFAASINQHTREEKQTIHQKSDVWAGKQSNSRYHNKQYHNRHTNEWDECNASSGL
jgi:hypothetical protein